jgi:nucleoside-triphosphatase THEP1
VDDRITLITGPVGAGKTTRAAALAAEARARGDRVAGVLSVKLVAGVGYAFEDLRTGRRIRYAVRRRAGARTTPRRRFLGPAGQLQSRFRFLRRGLRFGRQALSDLEADLVVVDELGPLELGPVDRGRPRRAGLWPAVERLLTGSQARLVIVVRERLVEALTQRLRRRSSEHRRPRRYIS